MCVLFVGIVGGFSNHVFTEFLVNEKKHKIQSLHVEFLKDNGTKMEAEQDYL